MIRGEVSVGLGVGVRRNMLRKAVNRMHSGQRLKAHGRGRFDSTACSRAGRKRHSHLTVLVVLGLKVIRPVVWIEERNSNDRHNGGEKVRGTGSEDDSNQPLLPTPGLPPALTACHEHAGPRAAAKTFEGIVHLKL